MNTAEVLLHQKPVPSAAAQETARRKAEKDERNKAHKRVQRLIDAVKIPDHMENVNISISMKDGLPIVYVAATVGGKDQILFKPGIMGVESNWVGSAQELIDLMAGQ